MADVEFLIKRMEGKQKEIEKLKKKLARIEKAKESDYEENNPYCYTEHDLFTTQREIENAKTVLDQYVSLIEEANNKAASRNIPTITKFLDEWEQRVTGILLEEYSKYLKAREEYCQKDRELCDKMGSFSYLSDERKELHKELKKFREDFQNRWTHVTAFNHGDKSWEETMRSDIAKEKNAKYDDLIERVVHITGKITNASNLKIGSKGDINGYIIGKDGKASVHTIDAGGYNIQCYHFRTLVRKMDKTIREHERLRKFEIIADEYEIKEKIDFKDADDLLDTLKKHLDYLYENPKDPLGWQQGIVLELQTILKNIKITAKEESK